MTLCVGTLFHEINDFECLISRIIGTIIILTSIFSLIFSGRFIYWSSYHRHVRFRHYPLIISMIVSSISVVTVIAPSVFIQCLSCYRICSVYYCRLEGFVSYLNGCVHMFMLMMISIIRYSTVFQTNIKKRYFDRYSFITVIICWLFGLVFALPPLFNWNKYTPEGIGFHCGLDWFDRSISSRIYFILTFAFVYFIPLIVLFVVNVYVYCVIRRLLYGAITMTKSNILTHPSDQKHQSTSLTPSSNSSSGNRTTQFGKSGFSIQTHSVNVSSRLVIRGKTGSFNTNQLMQLNRLKADRRFALATIFLVSEYLLSWTPYAIVALFYIFNIQFISQQSVSMTICAFIAKISMILNPFIYIATIKTSQLSSILSCKKCLCSYCKMKRNIVAS
jgi:hypothetical protein